MEKLAEQAVIMYNRALALYDTYLFCEPLKSAKKNMSDDGAINK